jgi:hypothetical protein
MAHIFVKVAHLLYLHPYLKTLTAMRNSFFIVGVLSVIFCSCGKTVKDKAESVSDTLFIKEYYSDGTIKSVVSAKGELRQGWTRNYSRKGQLISEVFYVDNVRHGPVRNYYATSGKLNSSFQYVNGIKEGDEIWYYESGQKYRVSPFVKGKINGIQKLYYENGNVMAEIPYKDGSPGIGLKEYSKDGTLIKDYPRLLIQKEDHLRDANKVLLLIRLSDGDKEVKLYKGTLTDGKYMHDKLLSLATQNGVAQLDFNIPPGAAVSQKITVVANYKTRRGNPLILSKTYDLQVLNNE